ARIRPVLHHAADACLAPGRDTSVRLVDALDGGERGLADGGAADVYVEPDPPLVGGAEDDRVLAPPAVRVAVADLEGLPARVEQSARRAKLVDDLRVRVEHVLAREPQAGFDGKAAALVDRRPDGQAVLDAHVEVVFAVPRGGVHQAGARLGGSVRAE